MRLLSALCALLICGMAEAAPLDEPFETAPLKEPTHPLILREWRTMPMKLRADAAALWACREDAARCTPAATLLIGYIDAARRLAPMARTEMVDAKVNELLTYMEDRVQWLPKGKEAVEVWTSPLDAAASRKGDCEEYVNLKFFLLWQSGMPLERMRLVLVEYPGDSEMHLVLAVKPERLWLILDSQQLRRAAPLRVVYALDAYHPDRAEASVATALPPR